MALACALADALGEGVRIAVADRAPLDTGGPRDARAFALSAGSKRMLTVLGVWPRIAEHAQPVTTIDITDSSLEDAFRPVLVSYDNTVEGGEPATYIVEHGRLHEALLAVAASRQSIVLLGGATAESFAADEHGVAVSLSGRAPLRATLLVAADGGKSRLREAAGIKVVRWSYPQAGIVTTVRHAEPHHGRAVQHFLPGRAVRHPAADGQPLVHHLDGGGEPGTRRPGARRCRLSRRGRDALRLPPGCRRAGGPARVLAARHAPCPSHGRQSLGAGRRCGARRSPDCRPGPEPRPARRGRAVRGRRRRGPARPRFRLAGRPRAL